MAASSYPSQRKRLGLIAQLRADRVEAVAVSLLFSFLNPEDEARSGATCGRPSRTPLSTCRAKCCRKFASSTHPSTAVCAYVGPMLCSFLLACSMRRKSWGCPASMSWGRTVACSKLARVSPCRPLPWKRDRPPAW